MTAHVADPLMKLPPRTPIPCRVNTAPATAMTMPTRDKARLRTDPASTILVFRASATHHLRVTEDAPDRRILSSAAAIIGADERQQVEKGNPVPPPPPLGIVAKTFLWVVFLLAFVHAVIRFAHGQIGLGIASSVGGLVAVVIRFAIIDGRNKARWEDPRYRNLRSPQGEESKRR